MTRLRATRFHLLAVAIAMLAVIVYAGVAQASNLINAYRYESDSNNVDGVRASIETDNPNTGSGWAYHRVGVIERTPHMYAEIGWVKGYKNADVPKVLAVYRDDSLDRHEWFYHSQYPTVGSSYDYRVSHTTSNYWGFYFDRMSSPVMSADIGWDTGDLAFGGGETSPTSDISIGDADYEDAEYRQAGSGSWVCMCSEDDFNQAPDDYEILDGSSSNDWRVKDD